MSSIVTSRASKGKETFVYPSNIEDSDLQDGKLWGHGADILAVETPKSEWKLVSSKKIEGTEHLSLKAQEAFIGKDAEVLQTELADIVAYWKEIWGENFDKGPGEEVAEALKKMPDIEELLRAVEKLPEGASIPSIVEVVYDHLVLSAAGNQRLFENSTVATASSIPPMPEIDPGYRPLDISFSEYGGIILHMRRSDRMGRPNKLGDLESGVPISYLQH